ncbi:MAG: type I 3-dehydroquinate dehydratase [Planctomycetota bacterium]
MAEPDGKTLVCVPIAVETIDRALDDARLAEAKSADLVEFRIDGFFSGGDDGTEGVYELAQLRRLLDESPLPVILTCRPVWEGGEYDGEDAARVALFEKLCADGGNRAPAYLDVELAAYTRSANLRQKVNLCVTHPKQVRDVTTRLILSMHDFEGRPADLDRNLLRAIDEPACAVVKVAYRARSLRDNLELFEIIARTPKPTIALGMGEFGLMSRVLAPKFGGFLTFASLRESSATAPGQPTVDELLGMYRFRSIGRQTRVYGVIGWPVGHSRGPLIHNAGFAEVGWDGVYLPLPVAADGSDPDVSQLSFEATLGSLMNHEGLDLVGASITIPHKRHAAAAQVAGTGRQIADEAVSCLGAANTMLRTDADVEGVNQSILWRSNTDAAAIDELMLRALLDLGGSRIIDGEHHLNDRAIAVVGAGGAARAAAYAAMVRGAEVTIYNRTFERADEIASDLMAAPMTVLAPRPAMIGAAPLERLGLSLCDLYINCTPVGMEGGPDPEGLSIPIPEMTLDPARTVFFDTVYTPAETPMLREARARGFRTIDGVEMFVRQAALQFELWTGEPAPAGLFERLMA